MATIDPNTVSEVERWQKRARAAEDGMTAQDIWPAILQDRVLGTRVQLLLGFLADIPKPQLIGASQLARQQISRLTSIGPIFDPSAWMDGRRDDNARHYSQILQKLCELRDLLPDTPTESEEDG